MAIFIAIEKATIECCSETVSRQGPFKKTGWNISFPITRIKIELKAQFLAHLSGRATGARPRVAVQSRSRS